MKGKQLKQGIPDTGILTRITKPTSYGRWSKKELPISSKTKTSSKGKIGNTLSAISARSS